MNGDTLSKAALVVAVISLVIAAYAAAQLGQLGALQEQLRSLEEKLGQVQQAAPQTVTQVQTVTQPAGKVVLRVIGPWSGPSAEYFKAVIDNYTKINPNVEIEYIARRAEDLAKTLPVQFEAGTAPADVIITPWAWFIVEMAKKGHVMDVSDLIVPDQYISGIVDKVMYDGKIYGAPFTMWLKPGFWYKKSFFEKNGLSEPKSWDEFLQLLDKLKQVPGVKNPIVSGDGVGWPLSDVTEHFLITFGGPELQLKLISGEVKFTDPTVEAVFKERLVPLISQGYFSEPIEWTSGVDLWWNEEYGLYFMGTWIAGRVPDPTDIDFFPLPGAQGVVGGADYGFIPKYANNVDVARDFLKFIATNGQGYHVAGPAGKIPTWKGIGVDQLWAPMQSVYKKISELNMQILPDLDDSVGGDWQTLFWDQLKLLWVDPGQVDQVLKTLADEFPS